MSTTDTSRESIRSYRQHPPEGSWDAIVVGSGIGGLTAAAALAREGERVLVLERHWTAGGFTHVFHRGKYEWDVGVHYIGGVGHPKAPLTRLFDVLSGGKLEWADMGEVYDRVYFGDDAYDFHKGPEAFVEHLSERFPAAADRRAIQEYVTLIRDVGSSSRMFFAEKAVPGLIAGVAGGLMRRKFMKAAKRTTHDVLSSLTDNPRLIGVLAAQFGDYGLPPRRSSFAMHAMVAGHYLYGGAYPVGGSSRFAETFADVIASSGGVVMINAEVERILVRDDRAVGVRLADGVELEAPIVISGAGVHTTYGRLLGEGSPAEHVGSSHSESVAHLGLYLGFEKTAAELDLDKTNLWIYPDGKDDHDANVNAFLADPDADFPVVYVSFPSAKDPDWERRHPGTATVDVITFGPYERFAAWQDRRWKRRGDDYEALKQSYVDRLLEVLYRYRPSLRDQVDHAELSTPLTTRDFTAYDRGEIYGLEHDPARFSDRRLRPRTDIKNLYLTGQDVVTCGVAGALMSGLLTVSAIRGRDAIKDVLGKA